MFNSSQEKTLKNLRNADGCNFAVLVKIAGLDPKKDLRGADLRGVDFGASDLRGFDFTLANLNGAKLDKANVVDAIFDKAQIEDVVWPNVIKRKRLHSPFANHELHPVQQEAFRRILDALQKSRPRGGLVSMPAGTGRAAIIERVLRELNEGRRYSFALLVVETVAEREQYMARLGELMSRRFDAKRTSGKDHAGLEVEVTTLGALRHAFKEQGNAALIRLSESGLIIASCGPGYVLSTAELVKKSKNDIPIIGFTNLPSVGRALNGSRQAWQLKELFGDFLYVLDTEAALVGRLLERATVEHRQILSVDQNMQRMMPTDGVLSDLSYQIIERSQSAQCLVICRDIEANEFVASALKDRLEGVSAKRVLAVSSRSAQPEFWAAVDEQEVVLVMTPAMAQASTERAIWSSGLIAVLTAVNPVLSERLRFRPFRAKDSPVIVLDYTDSVN